MATLTTFTAGTVIRAAEVNANFTALNDDISTAGVCLYSSVSGVQNVGTGESTLMSFSMPALTFVAVGDFLVVRAAFSFQTPSTPGAVKFYVGSASGTINVTTTSPAINTGMVVELVAAATAISGATSTVVVRGFAFMHTINVATSPVLESAGVYIASGTVAGDFASAQTVKFTGTAAGGSNTIAQTAMHVIAYHA
jgi:hypothetical protein